MKGKTLESRIIKTDKYKEIEDKKKQLLYRDKRLKQLLAIESKLSALENLYSFSRYMFNSRYGENSFVERKAIEALVEHLQATIDGGIKRLVINIMPRLGKTLYTSIYLPAYIHLHNPEKKIISVSYSDMIAKNASLKTKMLIESEEYKELDDIAGVRKKRKEKVVIKKSTEDFYLNNYEGYRYSAGLGATITGFGADFIIIDDPLKAAHANSTKTKKRVIDDLISTVFTRINHDSPDKVIILIMQRLAEDDPAGFLVETGEWEHLNLPFLYTGESKSKTSLHFKDWRTTIGEPLVDDLYTEKELQTLQNQLANDKLPITFEQQYQQNPGKKKGNVVNVQYFQTALSLSSEYDHIILGADLSYITEDNNDYTGMVVTGIRKHIDKYCYTILDMIEERLEFEEVVDIIKMFDKKYSLSAKCIEEEIIGPATIAALRDKVPGIVPIKSRKYGKSKLVRLQATIPVFQDFRIFFPNEKIVPLVKKLKNQLLTFPFCKNDDLMDAFIYTVLYGEENLVPALTGGQYVNATSIYPKQITRNLIGDDFNFLPNNTSLADIYRTEKVVKSRRDIFN